MNDQILYEAGLTKSEIIIYTFLVKNNPNTPPRLAELASESRTNTYKLLDSLEEKGLVSRDETQKKLRYWANNPSVLLDSLKKQRDSLAATEQKFRHLLPELMNEYTKSTQQPTIRHYIGRDGIKKVFAEQLQTAEPIVYIRNNSDINFFGYDFMAQVRESAAAYNIPRTSISPLSSLVRPDWKQRQKTTNQTRIWFEQSNYTAPVEWSVFGNKVAAISYGDEAVSMIIESEQIAESMRQLLTLLACKLKRDPSYTEPDSP